MENIISIFKGEIFKKPQNIIKSIKIDRKSHVLGILNIFKYLEPNFIVNEYNKEVIGRLLDYFVGAENSFYDLNKGIAIFGGVGTGKSLIFKVFKIYTKNIIKTNSFISHNAQDIIDIINTKGVGSFDSINYFNGVTSKPTTIYVDDVASKNETVKNYGTEISVIESLLSVRYNIYARYQKLTHISSNKYPNELTEIYDVRIVDRMVEMFNIVELDGESHRK